ncbi:DUF354 domain-containing protein [Methanosarcina sp.]|uniref:DUF354 domain-containing protein n=1 Tax=Methanosarcina sp. TaxID=2213 RepID=UPI0029893ECF|nr:DUF354 domain-containing protein [Methanosarcina sp.]MDW5549182.1 DUF354 domain-containing protein [Methanosarcina sp.]MDW5553112.1 DUF354 domain-containing protein [Methanosarcina sp.]MDW5559362.1 DUF354 domain-containing protein [Methanosarcina sp.]
MGHPGQVHLFKNAILELEKKGHQCKITIIDKEVSSKLLEIYGFEHEVVGAAKSSMFAKAIELLKIESRLLKICKSFKPDILVGGVGNAYVAHVGKLIGKPSIVFDDTEHSKIEHFLTDPFATVICTPSCYKLNLGKKQVMYDGYHELAYLHPNYFTPNPKILKELGLKEDNVFIILRFVSWNAIHDVGHIGLTLEDKRNAISEFEKYGCVLISSEKPLQNEFEKYQINVSPEKMHHLLYYATLLYGESATMASECAVLGTHAIFCDYAGRGYTDEEEKYDLVYNFKNEEIMGKESLCKAIKLLENPNLKKEGKKKREILLKDKIDVTEFIVRFIENCSITLKKRAL